MRDVISNEIIKEINEVIDEILTNIDDNVRNIVGAGNYSLPTIFSYTNYSGQTVSVHGSTFRHEVIIDNADGNTLIGDICTVIGDRKGIKLAKAGVEDRHDAFANYWNSTFDIAYSLDNIINGYVFDMHNGYIGEGANSSSNMSFKIDGLEIGKSYTLTFTGRFARAEFVVAGASYARICSDINATPYIASVTLEKDTVGHVYRLDFTNNTQSTTLYLNFNFLSLSYEDSSYVSEFIAENLVIAGMNIGIISRYMHYNRKWYPIEAGGGTSDLDAIELTYAEYQALTPAEKTDPDKIYFITDYPSGSGVVINPTGTATDTAETIEVDGTIYDFAGTDADAVHTADIGVAGGVAELDANGKVPSAQLPTYPTVGNGTITIQKNGTNVDTFTTNQSSNKTVNITMSKSDVGLGNVDNTSDANKPISTATQAALDDKADASDIGGVKTVTGNPLTLTDGSETYADELFVDLEPIQDLHGYDKPWVGGAGKNLFNYEQLKNASGWTENNGVYSGSISSMYSYAVNGFPSQPAWKENTRYAFKFKVVSATGNSRFRIMYTDDSYSDFVIESSRVGDYISNNTTDGKTVSKILFTYNSGGDIALSELQIEEGTTYSKWEPYTNISPIQGYDIVNVDRCGKNLWDFKSHLDYAKTVNSNLTWSESNGQYTVNNIVYLNQVVYAFSKTDIPVRFSIKAKGNGGQGVYLLAYDVNGTEVARGNINTNTSEFRELTFSATCSKVLISYANQGGMIFTEPQIELGSQTTVFEPFDGQTVSLQLGNKNLLPMTVEGIKAANTGGTWSGNAYTYHGIKFTILTDESDNIIGIDANGTESDVGTDGTDFFLCTVSGKITQDCKLSGGISNDFPAYIMCYQNNSYVVSRKSSGSDRDILKSELDAYTYNSWRGAIRVSHGFTANHVVFKPMLRDYLVTDSTFSPYNPTLGGMVYGATVDVANGVMVVDKACKNIGEFNFELYSADSTNHSFVVTAPSDAKPVANNGTLTEAISSSYEAKVFGNVSNFTQFNSAFAQVIEPNRFVVRDVNYTSASAFKTAMASQQIVYPLATPITIPLTPTQLKLLKGYNYITSNGTTIHLTYQPDNAVGDAVSEAEKFVERFRPDTDIVDTFNLYNGNTKVGSVSLLSNGFKLLYMNSYDDGSVFGMNIPDKYIPKGPYQRAVVCLEDSYANPRIIEIYQNHITVTEDKFEQGATYGTGLYY